MVRRGAGGRRGGIGGGDDARLCMGGAKAAVRVAARVGVSFGTLTRVEAAAPPPAQGQASPPPRSSVPPPLTTSYPPAPTTPPAAAHKKERVDSPRPASSDSFLKDGREFRVGDCALFQAVEVPPFIGLIRWIEKKEEGFPKLRVSWLYRPADIKLNKGTQLCAAPNEIFYSFHQDETSAVSLLHPCKVAFLRKGVELPAGISSFVCRRVYDIDNKCLWWLTDQDYINERQEEVNRLLHRTKLEMHAAIQSGGRSPKRLNGPSSAQQKSGSDGAQNCGLSKGKKRDRGEQGTDPAKRDRERPLKAEDGESGNFKVENLKSEITKITEKGGLPHAEAVEKLVHLMQLDRTERKIDLPGRVILADIIAATESPDCLGRFVQLRGLPVFDDWLQEAHKGKSGEAGSPKETDKPMEDLVLALLRALAKLPINLTALQSCSIGKSVNHLRSHKNPEIQKKAKCLVENWKKRVDAEMKSNDVKPVVSGQAVSWPGKPGFPEISSAGNRRSGSSESSLKSPVSQLSSSKALTSKPVAADAAAKSSPVISGSSKLQHMQPGNAVTNLKEQPSKSTGGTCGSELPAVKEEKSSSSSQSLNNSQSCSSEHAKTIGSSKEDARSSTAASGVAYKTSGSSSRVHRRTNNGLLGSGIQKEAAVARSSSLDHSSVQEKVSQSGTACEKGADIQSDQGNSHRLIVRFPNPGRSPARSASGGSFEDPSFTGSRASSPVADKHEQSDRRVKMKTENSNPHLGNDTNAESWHSNDVKGASVSEEGDKSPRAMLTDDSKTTEGAGRDVPVSRVACSSYANEKGICSSETGLTKLFNPMNALIEIKYSEASHSLQAGDDTAMNLLASVAGEISKSELISSSPSPRNSSANEQGCEGDNIGKLKVECDVSLPQHAGPSNEVEKVISEKSEKSVGLVGKELHREDVNMLSVNNLLSQGDKGTTSAGSSPLPEIDSKAKTENREVEDTDKCSHPPSRGDDGVKSNAKQPIGIKIDTNSNIKSSTTSEYRSAFTVRGKVEDGCTTSSDVGSTLGDQCKLAVSNRKMLPAEEPLCGGDKQAHGLLKPTDQKHLLGLPDYSEHIDKSGDSTANKLKLKPSFSSSTVEVNKADGLLVGSNTVLKEDEKKEHPADVTKLAVATGVKHGPENGISSKESKDNSSESSSHTRPGGTVSQETEHSAQRSSKKSSDDAGGKDDLVSSDDGSSFSAKTRSNATAKLDFDLNEGIPGDEGHLSEPATSPAVCSSAIHLPRPSPFVSPISSGLPAPIAAPAKGPFVPPENLIRLKSETGWKGSAATSAFRPAEPRKIFEMTLSAPGIPVSDAAGKNRPALDIDLNVADEQFLEEDVSQSSVQTTGSESGNTRRSNGPVRSVGFELDLNRADEVAENGQIVSNTNHRVEVPLLSRPLPGVFSSSDANNSRDFDLNNGPTLDEAGTEHAPRSLSSKNTSSIPFLPQVASMRMNSAEMSNISPWFASANACAPVAIKSFLPSRGEQPHPVETAAGSGTQRIITSMADGVQHGSDPSRTPVISTSPTMMFHPPAYQYAGFPFTPSVHLQAPGFSIGSTSYANSASGGIPYFPTIAPTLVGPAGALPAQHTRQYAINLPEGSSTVGHDNNRKWGRQGLDLNSGPGSVDVEVKDDRVTLPVRQNFIAPPHAFVDEHTRMYQMPPGVGIKRKEPEGSWDAERSSYKQLSWQ
uniref:BAH domain-containing protein n=1 Tax=Oryza nivara TaxID=4536 RepID=A0A0E0HLE0_ORYNI